MDVMHESYADIALMDVMLMDIYIYSFASLAFLYCDRQLALP